MKNLLLLFLFSMFTASCTTRQRTGQKKVSISIARIENSLIPIDNSGRDSGTTQSVLSRMDALGVPGMSVAVFDQGRIIWAKGYGLSDKKLFQKVDTATIFQAASISKPVTSVAMFRLVEKKIINLDDDVNIHLRSWKVPENEYTEEVKVTPRRIVSHMAGLTVHGFYGYSHEDSIPSILQILDGLPPANSKPVRVSIKPGTEEVYSGGGFTVLQLLLEEQTGKPFSVLMNDLVIKPIGMKQSFFSLKIPDAMSVRQAKGYRNGEMVDGGYNVYPEQAAAGLWTTPSDLARFMLNIGGSYRGNLKNGILQQSTVRSMFTRVPGGGGLGFGIDGSGNSFRFRHNGGNEGFRCYAISFANVGRGVVIMTNSDSGSQLIHELVRAIAREYQWPAMWPRE